MTSLPRLAAGRYLQWRFDHWTREKLAAHQQRRSDRLAAYLRKHSPYYAERVEIPQGDRRTTLANFPVMTKAEMMACFDSINTAGLRREDLVPFQMAQERSGRTELWEGRYSIGLSSGTSGNKVLTVLSPRERIGYSALLWARCGIPRSVQHPRVLFTLRTNNPAFTAVTALGVRLVYADYFVSLDDLVSTINRERLNVLAGPPSLLAALAERQGSLTTRIQGIVSYAEELDDTTRERVSAPWRSSTKEQRGYSVSVALQAPYTSTRTAPLWNSRMSGTPSAARGAWSSQTSTAGLNPSFAMSSMTSWNWRTRQGRACAARRSVASAACTDVPTPSCDCRVMGTA
jgi:putative adenylate-forming enzyme